VYFSATASAFSALTAARNLRVFRPAIQFSRQRRRFVSRIPNRPPLKSRRGGLTEAKSILEIIEHFTVI